MNTELHHFFTAVGIPLYEGWGMTEGCPATTNRPGRNKIGTIGPPLQSVDIKISPEGEILMRGPIVMRGYHKNPAETANSLDSEGWMHTGDRGTIDSEGYVKIVGRLKEMLKTSNGKYVVPGPIEQELGRIPWIEWAMVVANGRKFAACLLFPNRSLLRRLKEEHGDSAMADEEFLRSPVVTNLMTAEVERINATLNPWEQLRKYTFILETLTIDSGELTPSMKIRREVVEKKFEKEIEALYA